MSSLDLSDRNGIWINISPFWESSAPHSFPPAFLQIIAPLELNWHPQTKLHLHLWRWFCVLLGVLHPTASSEQGRALQV